MDHPTPLLLHWSNIFPHQNKILQENVSEAAALLSRELEAEALKHIRIRDEEIAYLKEMLRSAVRERDDARGKCRRMLVETAVLHGSLHGNCSGCVEDDRCRRLGIGFCSSSDCDESIVSSPPLAEIDLPVAVKVPLPVKGKLLEAVVKAGPLLQTLLITGTLPQWRRPPPPIVAGQIPAPPVVVPPPPRLRANSDGCENRVDGGSDCAGELKCQPS